jgi:hypothetical protein
MCDLRCYLVCCIVIWFIIGILFFRKELKTFFFLEQAMEELPRDVLMGVSHDVFQEEKEVAEKEEDIMTESVLSEDNFEDRDDFEVEYEDIEMNDGTMFDDGSDDRESVTSDESIIGFKEIQQMVAVAESDKPLQHIDKGIIKETKRVIKQIEDTDFYEKMIKAREDISRRLDEIVNSI